MPWLEINHFVGSIRALCPAEPITIETHDRAHTIAERYGLNIFDALIVAAALLAKCNTLYSEDMQHNLEIDRQLHICNPFLQT
jgi:predicted nucleic acid-binding protein